MHQVLITSLQQLRLLEQILTLPLVSLKVANANII